MARNEHDPKLIQKFIQEYNLRIDWNLELCASLDIDALRANPCACQVFDAAINLEHITPELYDVDNAEIYQCEEPGKYEFQAYSYERYTTSYFWVDFNETKDEYIKYRIQLIHRYIAGTIDEIRPKLEKLTQDMIALKNLQTAFNQ